MSLPVSLALSLSCAGGWGRCHWDMLQKPLRLPPLPPHQCTPVVLVTEPRTATAAAAAIFLSRASRIFPQCITASYACFASGGTTRTHPPPASAHTPPLARPFHLQQHSFRQLQRKRKKNTNKQMSQIRTTLRLVGTVQAKLARSLCLKDHSLRNLTLAGFVSTRPRDSGVGL